MRDHSLCDLCSVSDRYYDRASGNAKAGIYKQRGVLSLAGQSADAASRSSGQQSELPIDNHLYIREIICLKIVSFCDKNCVFRGSSQLTVNQLVVGSNPTRGATFC